MHELLVDEEPAKGGEISVSSSDDLVYLGLRVAPSWLEIFDQPTQYRQSLLVLRGDSQQPARRINEVLQDANIGVVHLFDPALHHDRVEAQPAGELL